MDESFKRECEEVMAYSKALLDADDILGWTRLMAADEQKMLEQYGCGNPRPFQMIVSEIERLRMIAGEAVTS